MKVTDYLDQVRYPRLDEEAYVPSAFALKFANFIKMVNADAPESHPTPVVHLKMLDKLRGRTKRLVNLCSRGFGKTVLFAEYLPLFVAVFEEIEGFGEISGMLYISDSVENGVKSARKNIEYKYRNSEFLQYWLPEAKFTDVYIEFTNRNGHQLGLKMFGAQSGLRGTKIFGKRPTLCVMDDLVSDEDARSKTVMASIRDTVYKGVDYALDPTRKKIVFNGTPFNQGDILYEAVESGSWAVNVWPICERFPCTEEEFRGAWEERFSYEYVKEQYENAMKDKQITAFMQELMLRVTSEEERLIQPSDIRWYDRDVVLKNKSKYNFYMTSDFATTDKESSDYNVVSVWAYNDKKEWFLVDGVREQQTMDKTINDIFRLHGLYPIASTAIEVTGQQAGFVAWLQSEMEARGTWFTLASSGNSSAPGIRPVSNKTARFSLAVPLFLNGQIYFPEQLRNTRLGVGMVEEVTSATPSGFKSKHDDCADNVSQLVLLKAWTPSSEPPASQPAPAQSTLWENQAAVGSSASGFSAYSV